MDILATQIASGDADVTEDRIAMTDMPPFFERLFGTKPSNTKIANPFRKIIGLMGRGAGREQPGSEQSPT
jgi:hypothetical protein